MTSTASKRRPVPPPRSPPDTRTLADLGAVADVGAACDAAVGDASRSGHGVERLAVALLTSFPQGAVVVFDHDLRYVSAGGRGLADVGLSREMLEGNTIFEVFPPETASFIEPGYRLALAGGESTLDTPFRGRVYEVGLSPVWEDGVVVAGMGFTQDVTAARASERALRESEEHLRLSFDHAPIGMALVGLDRQWLRVNPALCRILGYSEPELLALTFQDVTHPDDLDADLTLVAQLLSQQIESYTLEKRYRHARGDYVWLRLSAALAWGENGDPRHFISQLEDVNERVLAEAERDRAEQALAQAHAFQAAVLAASPDVIGVMDVATFSSLWASRSVGDLLGYSAQDIADMGPGLLDRIVVPDDLVALRAGVLSAAGMADGERVELRHRVVRADGAVRWLHRRMTPFQRDAHERATQVLAVSSDVTAQVEVEQRLEYTALHDSLTGLPNRALISDRLRHAIAQVDRGGTVAVLFCDLDGFKRINDGFGHATGDRVLIAAARRLSAHLRVGDTVGRMGGDEFVVLVTSNGDEAAAERLAVEVAGRVRRDIAAPVHVDDVEHTVTISIGIALAGCGADADTVLRDADTAMYRAKTAGKNGHTLFRPAMHEDALLRTRVERLLRVALARDRVGIHYQPLVSSVSGLVVGVEALLRVPDPMGGHLPTVTAVAVAEETGLIAAVGERLLRDACTRAAAWRATPGLGDLVLSVNISATEIARTRLAERVLGTLEVTGLEPAGLTLEITESVLLEAGEQTVADLRSLREAGVGIAIDDFGTGYASLQTLSRLPVSCVKVDRSFTAGFPDDPTRATLVMATLRLAADLGLRCVVEGVETPRQHAALPSGPEISYQGYLFARPAPEPDLFASHPLGA